MGEKRYETVVKELTTSPVTFHTAGQSEAMNLVNIMYSNKTTNTPTVTFYHYQLSTTTSFSIGTTLPVASKGRYIIESGSEHPLIRMKKGDYITCEASANSEVDCHVTVSIETLGTA